MFTYAIPVFSLRFGQDAADEFCSRIKSRSGLVRLIAVVQHVTRDTFFKSCAWHDFWFVLAAEIQAL